MKSLLRHIGTTLAFLALRSLSRPLLHAILVTRKDVSNRFKSYKLLQFLQLLQNVILVWISSKVKSGCQCPYRYGGTLVPSISKLFNKIVAKLQPWPETVLLEVGKTLSQTPLQDCSHLECNSSRNFRLMPLPSSPMIL